MRLRIYFLAVMLLPGCTGKQMISKTIVTDGVVYWSETRKLAWDDFQGEPVVVSGNASSPACEIVVQNPASIERKNLLAKTMLVAECYFDKKRSWVNKARASDELLLYNQVIKNKIMGGENLSRIESAGKISNGSITRIAIYRGHGFIL